MRKAAPRQRAGHHRRRYTAFRARTCLTLPARAGYNVQAIAHQLLTPSTAAKCSMLAAGPVAQVTRTSSRRSRALSRPPLEQRLVSSAVLSSLLALHSLCRPTAALDAALVSNFQRSQACGRVRPGFKNDAHTSNHLNVCHKVDLPSVSNTYRETTRLVRLSLSTHQAHSTYHDLG